MPGLSFSSLEVAAKSTPIVASQATFATVFESMRSSPESPGEEGDEEGEDEQEDDVDSGDGVDDAGNREDTVVYRKVTDKIRLFVKASGSGDEKLSNSHIIFNSLQSVMPDDVSVSINLTGTRQKHLTTSTGAIFSLYLWWGSGLEWLCTLYVYVWLFFFSVQVIDTASTIKSVESLREGLTYFFVLVAVVADILCFFMLWATISNNVKENQWELAVMYSIGFKRGQVQRIYLYESLALTLTSVFEGTITGLLIATSISLQYQIFTEGAFELKFPWILYLILIFLGLITAVIASFFVLRKQSSKHIAKALRSTSDAS